MCNGLYARAARTAGPGALWLLGAVGLLTLLMSGCAGKGDARDDGVPFVQSAEFPMPAGLEDNVAFWRNVYAKWGRDKVIIHDDEHMGVIYQVAQLPGPIEEVYTPAQKDYVRSLSESWRARLRALERRVAERARLSAEEKQLKAQLEQKGGPGAVFGADERVRSQRGVRERYRGGLERSGRWEPAFQDVFRRHGLPEDLALLPHVESSFQANARSSAGASGMWQFIRSTGKSYMTVNSSIDERLDPVVAADAAARYLKNSYSKLHNWPMALTSYNHGLGGMMRAKERYGTDFARIVRDYDGKYFGFASRNFYAQFLAARHVARNADRYFPEGLRFEPPLRDQSVRLPYALTVDELSRRYRVPPSALLARNLAWLAPIRNGSRPVPAGSKVWLPEGAARAQGALRASAF
ncbi:lytic transglycosylase domain-containing protein [Thiohalocapsa sp. ML1]|jgi:membrane-bound lytic murein transglycosylase D|uniref:lytic transglycosylase domain-containing protein n=1 Tax=Thiohalocapsa sp. ML1 TaxID=1431688 RepID=UPI0009EC511E|nr:lytic transglycosylase domain-containing protein [Thiohalocapsa sp. ML1]